MMAPEITAPSRGQLSGIDMMFGVFLFMIVIAVISIEWTDSFNYAKNVQMTRTTTDLAISLSNQLVSFEGEPQDWNATTVKVIGLAIRQNLLSQGKINTLAAMNITAIKDLLGVSDYHLLIRIFKADLGGDNVALFGETLPGNASSASVIDSYAALNNEVVIVRVTLWRSL